MAVAPTGRFDNLKQCGIVTALKCGGLSAMPEYRLYRFRDNHIYRVEIVAAESDSEASDKAEKIANGEPVEIWRGGRRVGMFNRAGT
jgi:hypothetical protein